MSQQGETIRERILQELAGSPAGLSRSELERRVEGNRGAFKRVLARVIDCGDVTVEEEQREYGPTRVHRLADQRQAQADLGQLEIG